MGIVGRAYSGAELRKRPSLKDVTMCSEWLNFQTFCEWYKEQYSEDGWEIDKDVAVPGNTHYCPERCIIIPRRLNGKLPKRTSVEVYITKDGSWCAQ